jgi:hypothetical protein
MYPFSEPFSLLFDLLFFLSNLLLIFLLPQLTVYKGNKLLIFNLLFSFKSLYGKRDISSKNDCALRKNSNGNFELSDKFTSLFN